VFKVNKDRIIIAVLLLAIVIIGGLYTRERWRSNNYRGVSCIDCFRMTNYLRRAGSPLYAEDPHGGFFYGETVEELALELMSVSFWMCEACAHLMAEQLLNPPDS